MTRTRHHPETSSVVEHSPTSRKQQAKNDRIIVNQNVTNPRAAHHVGMVLKQALWWCTVVVNWYIGTEMAMMTMMMMGWLGW